jgi:Ulp1 family protease
MVNRALIPKPPQEILVSGYNKEITRRDIATLAGLNWLNDEVCNTSLTEINNLLTKTYFILYLKRKGNHCG